MTQTLTVPLTVLGIETSCDETAAAVVRLAADGRAQVLSSIILSQVAEHAPYGGVVPEIAPRSHVGAIDALVGQAPSPAEPRGGGFRKDRQGHGTSLSRRPGVGATGRGRRSSPLPPAARPPRPGGLRLLLLRPEDGRGADGPHAGQRDRPARSRRLGSGRHLSPTRR